MEGLTPDEFKAALRQLGWKQADFARKAGLSHPTPSRWVAGEVPIPEWAEAFLGMAIEVQRLHVKYVAILPGDRKQKTQGSQENME